MRVALFITGQNPEDGGGYTFENQLLESNDRSHTRQKEEKCCFVQIALDLGFAGWRKHRTCLLPRTICSRLCF